MNADQVTKLLADLVAIPSMNPMGRNRSGKEYSESQIAAFVASVLRSNGIDVEVYEIAPGRPNVMAFVDARARETILLDAHLDTVHADNMTIEPFSPAVRDAKLYGRGSCDTKGSVAAFLEAVTSSTRKGAKLRYNVLMLFGSDEEYRFGGAQAAAARGLRATFGIVGEPTRLAIVRAHKGVTRWRIRTRGKAVHSAYPELGTNAIYLMVPVIDRLQQHGLELRKRAAHPLLGTPSLSVGVIEGGQAVNIVPDVCWAEVDRRTLPGETTESVLESVRQLLRELPGVEFDPPYLSVGGMEVPADGDIVRLLSGAIESVRGKAEVEVAQYTTNAGIYSAAGIPTVVFGPGDIAQAHTETEFIELSQLEQAMQIVRRIILS